MNRPNRGPVVPIELLRREHAEAAGPCGHRVLLRVLILARGEDEVWTSAAWLASQLGEAESSGVRHALKRLELAGYLCRTGRARRAKGRTGREWEFRILYEKWATEDCCERDPQSRSERDPGSRSQGPERDPASRSERDPQSRSRSGERDPQSRLNVIPNHVRAADTAFSGGEEEQPPRATAQAPAQPRTRAQARTRTRTREAAAAAAEPETGSEPSDLLADALGELVANSTPSVEELSSAPTRSPVSPLAPVPLPNLTEDESIAELFAPMPLEIAKAWFAWWYPTDRAGLSQPWAMRERHRTVQALAELWSRLGDEADWRAMFRDVQRSELRSIRGMEAALARIGASRAPRSASARAETPPPAQRCNYAPACRQHATWRSTKGELWCERHRSEAVEMGVHHEEDFQPLDGASAKEPRSTAPTTREPREVPIVQQRAGKPAPAGNGSTRATA